MRIGLATAVLLIAPAAGICADLHYEWSRPQLYEYRDAFGQSESYVVVSYRVTNRGAVPARAASGMLLATPEGQVLNDGFRPLVQASFCLSAGCQGSEALSTPELTGREILPGTTLRGLALFLVPGHVPQRVVVSLGEGQGVAYSLRPAERAYVGSPLPSRDGPKRDSSTAVPPLDRAPTRLSRR